MKYIVLCIKVFDFFQLGNRPMVLCLCRRFVRFGRGIREKIVGFQGDNAGWKFSWGMESGKRGGILIGGW